MSIPVNEILVGDVLDKLHELPGRCVQTVITSPPYWNLRNYGVEGQIGLEATPEEYVTKIVEVFREVRRVLRTDGTLWLNLGDSYASDTKGSGGPDSSSTLVGTPAGGNGQRMALVKLRHGLKSKDLVGIPWRVAFALQADGWWLRSDIIWSKPNPMPESVTDRPTKAHEYIFLMAKTETYFYNAEAIKEESCNATTKMPDGWDTGPGAHGTIHRNGREKGAKVDKQRGHSRRHNGFNDRWDLMSHEEQANLGRNKRTVWTISTEPFPEAHFATFPTKLVEPCILAGSSEGGVVLDPFMGSGTVALVALKANRKFIGIELNPAYAEMARARIAPEMSQMKLA